MYILSLISSTLVSVVNAAGIILAVTGAFSTSYGNPAAGIIPRNVFPLAYNLILPAAFLLLILSLTIKSEKSKSDKRPVTFLRLSFILNAVQALVFVFLYQHYYTTITATEAVELNILPIIIAGAVITITFVGSIIFAIKATASTRLEPNISPKLFTIIALAFGILEIILDIITGVIFRIDPSHGTAQTLYQWMNYVRMLNPAILALAVLNTLKKPDRWTTLAWVGALLAFLGHIVVYLIIYL